MRRLASPLGIALCATLAVTAAQTASARPLTAPCLASQLTAASTGTNGAAGTIENRITFTSHASGACTVSGFPALKLYRGMTALTTHVVHGGLQPLNKPVHVITLAPHGKATVLVMYNDVPVGGQTTCPHGTALAIKVGSAWVRANVSTTACGGGKLHESPFLKGIPAL